MNNKNQSRADKFVYSKDEAESFEIIRGEGAMQDELTTEMHAEFLEGEISAFDLRIMGVYGYVSRIGSLKDALKRYSLTKEEYEANVKRVMND